MNKLNPLVSIVISTKNRIDDLKNCLKSVYELSYDNFEVIVNDNASEDNTLSFIKKHYPKVILISSKVDMGAAEGKNIGIRQAKGEFILFVDSDNILDKNIISSLMTTLVVDNNAVAGSKIYYSDDSSRMWSLGADINMYTSQCFHIGGDIDSGQYDNVTERGHFPCVYMIKKRVLDEVGIFDSEYFIMYEESDLQERIRKAGHKIVLSISAIAWHHIITIQDDSDPLRKIGLFNKVRSYYSARNRIIFMRKNGNLLNKAVFFPFFLPLFVIYYAFQIIKINRVDILKAYMKGIYDGLLWQPNKRRFL
jgi:GT2 family glycosyltransferase